jgi:hypothetical protein
MAKDLPYFKFFCSEWNDGDITLESYEAQGLFINICSYYWSNECDIHLDKLLKKFKGYNVLIADLKDAEIIKIKDNGSVTINFLDEQRDERIWKSKTNSTNGSKGGRPKKQVESENKPNALISLSETKGNKIREEKKRKEKSIEERKQDFRQSIEVFNKANINKYPKQLFVDFEMYWTEHGENDKKMRHELQKTFGLSQRLATWFRNGFNDYAVVKEKVIIHPHEYFNNDR